jgi:hypothetical protein
MLNALFVTLRFLPYVEECVQSDNFGSLLITLVNLALLAVLHALGLLMDNAVPVQLVSLT